jgi:hypothetical protein
MFDRTQSLRILDGVLVADIVVAVVSLGLGLLGGAVAEAQLERLGVALPDPADDHPAVLGLSCLMVGLLLPAQLVAWVGLFRRRAWGRWCYLRVAVAWQVASIAIGLFTYDYVWGLPAAVGDLNGILTGLVLGLCFASPAADAFTPGSAGREADAGRMPPGPDSGTGGN